MHRICIFIVLVGSIAAVPGALVQAHNAPVQNYPSMTVDLLNRRDFSELNSVEEFASGILISAKMLACRR